MKGKILLTLAMALVLSLGAATLPAAAQVQAPSITLSPTQGKVNQEVYVTGSGFEDPVNPAETQYADIYFMDAEQTEKVKVVDRVRLDGGSFEASFNVPQKLVTLYVAPGDYITRAENTENSGIYAQASFTVITDARITLSPTSGPPGRQITITGSGFYTHFPSLYVDITFNGQIVKSGVELNRSGGFTTVFKVPDFTPDTYTVKAYNHKYPTDCATKPFTIPEPRISLHPDSGVIGQEVRVNGYDFTAGSRIDIYFEKGIRSRLVGYKYADDSGSFITYFNVPSTIDSYSVVPADYVVRGINHGDSSEYDTESFTVVSQSTIELHPDEGNVGDKVAIEGQGFEPRRQVTVYFDGDEVARDYSHSNGSITISFEVPEAVVGSHSVRAEDTAGNWAQDSFKVKPRLIIAPGIVVPSQETLPVRGTGFSSRSEVIIRLQHVETCDKTNQYGSFDTFLGMPQLEPGEYVVYAEDDAGYSATAILHIGPELSLSPGNGHIGIQVTARGAGFASRGLVHVYYDTQEVAKDWTDAQGQLVISFIVPQSQHGSHVVRARDDRGNTAEATFTAESIPPAAPSLFTPRTGSQVDSLTPAFDWSDAQDPSGVTYSLELAHNDRFAPVVLAKTGLGASQYTLAEAEKLEPGTYYWRVRAIDNAGNIGQWSFIFTFEASAPGLSTGALIGAIVGGLAIVGCMVYLLEFRLRKRTAK